MPPAGSPDSNVDLPGPEDVEQQSPGTSDGRVDAAMERIEEDAPKCGKGKSRRGPGVIYLRRIPTNMSISRLRDYFERFGEVGRLYLRPESEERRERRKRNGGRATRQFEEGWVEFKKKRIAKYVSTMLNGSTVGGKKCGNRQRDELWTIKYLRGMFWEDLAAAKFDLEMTKKLVMESEIRKLQTEISMHQEATAAMDRKRKRIAAQRRKAKNQ